MKKEYEIPKVEKLEFDYSDAVTASSCTGGASQLYVDGYENCRETPTGQWSNPYGNQ